MRKEARKEGDVVLDPFMGGGTTAVVAEKLGRKWIGIDQSVQAVNATELRLKKLGSNFVTDKKMKIFAGCK